MREKKSSANFEFQIEKYQSRVGWINVPTSTYASVLTYWSIPPSTDIVLSGTQSGARFYYSLHCQNKGIPLYDRQENDFCLTLPPSQDRHPWIHSPVVPLHDPSPAHILGHRELHLRSFHPAVHSFKHTPVVLLHVLSPPHLLHSKWQVLP